MSQPSSKQEPGLVRALGPVLATALVVGTVIGTGVFKKPKIVALDTPNLGFAVLAWVLVGLLALLGGLSLAEVSILYPRAGGNYVFLREAYGRAAGFLWGWVEFWIIRSASIAALATIFSESLVGILRTPGVSEHLGLDPNGWLAVRSNEQFFTVAAILGLALLNLPGVRWGGFLQFFITSVKVGSLLAIILLPFAAAALHWNMEPPTPRPSATLVPFSMVRFGGALLGVIWAYHGWMNIAPVAEEIKNPNRNIPVALLGGIGILIFLYVGANLSYFHVMGQERIAASQGATVAAEFAEYIFGPVGVVVASAAVMVSTFGATNGNLLVGPRVLYAMGEDGLAPKALGKVHPRWRTPVLATLILASWCCVLVIGVGLAKQYAILLADKYNYDALREFAMKDGFDTLTDFAMFGAILFETSAVASIFVFRRRFPHADRPYRCPGYPVVPALYVLIMAGIAVNTFYDQPGLSLFGLGFIALGAVIYAVWLRRPKETVRKLE
jgi:APA family basic amino acid/polyamine antiporter